MISNVSRSCFNHFKLLAVVGQINLLGNNVTLLCEHTAIGASLITEQTEPSVVITMVTFNGEKFLAEQLDSFESQTHKNWRLIASDDGSMDGTLEVLKRYQAGWGCDRLEIRQGVL